MKIRKLFKKAAALALAALIACPIGLKSKAKSRRYNLCIKEVKKLPATFL